MKTTSKWKRISSLLLALALVLSLCPNVALTAQATDHTGGTVYFDNSQTKWTDSYIYFVIGHDSWSSVYAMTATDDTGNWYKVELPSWGGANYCAVIGTSSAWGDGGWSTSNLTNAAHYTAAYTDAYAFNSGSYYTVTPASGANGTGFTIASSSVDPLTGIQIESITVAGGVKDVENSNFINGASWDVSAESGKTTKTDGVYSITFTDVAAATYAFKFVANNAWTYSWGTGGELTSGTAATAYLGGTDSYFTVATAGSTVTLELDTTNMAADGQGATMKVTVTAPSTEPEEETKVTDYGFSFNGEEVTSANASDILGDGKVSYDADSHTLTVAGGRYIDGQFALWVKTWAAEQQPLKVRITGDTTVSNFHVPGGSGLSKLELTVDSGKTLTFTKYSALFCSLTVTGGKLIMNDGEQESSCLFVQDSLEVNGATLYAFTDGNKGCAISAGTATLTDATVAAYGKGSSIEVSGDLTVNKSVVAAGYVLNTDGKLAAPATASETGINVLSGKKLVINSGHVEAAGTTPLSGEYEYSSGKVYDGLEAFRYIGTSHGTYEIEGSGHSLICKKDSGCLLGASLKGPSIWTGHGLSYSDNGNGTHTAACSDCSYTDSSLTHTLDYSDNGDGTHTATCLDNCGYSDEESHTYVDGVCVCEATPHSYTNGICVTDHGDAACGAPLEVPTLVKDQYDVNGDNTKDEVYEIANAGQLHWFMRNANDENAVLTSDITMAYTDTYTWSPIGYYSGVFDGQNHTISNISGTNGLVSNLYGTVRNLTVSGAIESTGDEVGGIAGYASGGATIENCVNLCSVQGATYVGGIVGQMYKGTLSGTLKNTAAVEGVGDVGGILGQMQSGTLSGTLENTAAVEGVEYVGGILGSMSGGTFADTAKITNSGTVTGTGSDVGGILGYMSGGTLSGTLKNTTAVEGVDYVGGILGAMSGGKVADATKMTNSGSVSSTSGGSVGGIIGCLGCAVTISGAENTGDVTGCYYIGGILGFGTADGFTLSRCVNSGTIKVVLAPAGSDGYCAGGIAGQIDAVSFVSDCLNTGSVSAAKYSAGGIVGALYEGSVTGCCSAGSVTAPQYAGLLVGLNGSTGTVKNSAALTQGTTKLIGSSNGSSDNINSFDEAGIASGAAAYLLNGNSSEDPVWYQTLGEGGDSQPTLDSSHSIVYASGELDCAGNAKGDGLTYTNDKSQAVIKQDDHSYTGEIIYTWNGDYTECAASQACDHYESCGSSRKATASKVEASDPVGTVTCTYAGTVTYTATFTEDWAAENGTCTKSVDLPGEGHKPDYTQTPTWTWNIASGKVTASFPCTKCGEAEALNATVTSGTNENNETVLTATVSVEVDGESLTYTDTYTMGLLIVGGKDLKVGQYLDNDGNITTTKPENTGYIYLRSVDSTNYTVTVEMNGFALETEYPVGIVMQSDSYDMKLYVSGENSLTMTSSFYAGITGGQIYLYAETGDASLAIACTGETTSQGFSSGIYGSYMYNDGVALDISGMMLGVFAGTAAMVGADITIDDVGYGIYVEYDLYLDECAVDITAESYGIDTNSNNSDVDVSITDSDITIDCGVIAVEILGEGSTLTATGSTFTITVGENGYDAFNCYYAACDFADCTLDLTAPDDAIYAYDLYLTDCDVTTDSEYGLYVDNTEMVIDGGELYLEGEYAVYAEELTITGGAEVVVTGSSSAVNTDELNMESGSLIASSVEYPAVWGAVTLGEDLAILVPEEGAIGSDYITDAEGDPAYEVVIAAADATVHTHTGSGKWLSDETYHWQTGCTAEGCYLPEDAKILVGTHSYAYVDGKFVCACGHETDGVVMVGGKALKDGDYAYVNADGVLTISGEKPAEGGYAWLNGSVLTLNNFSLSESSAEGLYKTTYTYEGGYYNETYEYYSVICSRDDLTINVVGENTLYNGMSSFYTEDGEIDGIAYYTYGYGMGIDCYGDLTITGADTENILSVSAAMDGIYAQGTLTVENVTVNAKAWDENNPYAAIESDGDLVIKNAAVYGESQYYGLQAEYDVIITDSEAKVESCRYGIYSDEADVTIDGSEVTAVSCNYGIYSDDRDVVITDNAVVDVTGGSDGIYAEYDITIDGSEVKSNAGDDGICAGYGDLTIKDSEVSVESVNYGLYAEDNVTITGSELTIVSEDDGIYADDGDLTIKDSEITIDSGDYGIQADDENLWIEKSKLTIESVVDGLLVDGSGETLTITGSTLDITTEGDGIDSDGYVVITDSNVTISYSRSEEVDGYYGIEYSYGLKVSGDSTVEVESCGDQALYCGNGYDPELDGVCVHEGAADASTILIKAHVDEDPADCICDICGEAAHVDEDGDKICDNCEEEIGETTPEEPTVNKVVGSYITITKDTPDTEYYQSETSETPYAVYDADTAKLTLEDEAAVLVSSYLLTELTVERKGDVLAIISANDTVKLTVAEGAEDSAFLGLVGVAGESVTWYGTEDIPFPFELTLGRGETLIVPEGSTLVVGSGESYGYLDLSRGYLDIQGTLKIGENGYIMFPKSITPAELTRILPAENNAGTENLSVGYRYVYNVKLDLSEGLTADAPIYIWGSSNYTATLSADEGYLLPEKVVILAGSTILTEGMDYTYDAETGEINITRSTIVSDVTIQAKAPIVGTIENKDFKTEYIYGSENIEPKAENFTTNSDGFISFSWYASDKTTALESTPTDAGTYWLRASLAASTTYTSAECWVEVTIDPSPVSFAQITVTTPEPGKAPEDAKSAADVTAASTVWKDMDGNEVTTFGFSTQYQVTVTLTVGRNNVFTEDLELSEGFTIVSAEDRTVVATAAYTTRKAVVSALTAPADQTLKGYYTEGTAAIHELPKTAAVVSEDGIAALPITWTVESYSSEPKAVNTFTWAVDTTGYDVAEGVKTTGTVKITNTDAQPVVNTGKTDTVTYDGSTYDVAKLFEIDKNAGAAHYEVSSGTLNGSILTFTESGTITVTLTTDPQGGYAGGYATAALTVNKGEGKAEVTIEGWTYGESAKAPVVKSATNDATKYTVLYTGEDYSSETAPTQVGTYTVTVTLEDSALSSACTASAAFTIAPKAVEATVTVDTESFEYDGTEKVPAVTVKVGDTVIDESQYTVTVTDNVKVGTATVTITDKDGGSYILSGSATFQIVHTKHKYTGVVTKATCTEQGYTTNTCWCGDSYTHSYVKAKGHSWDDGVLVKEPAEGVLGEILYTCTACGETKTEFVSALDHVHSYGKWTVLEDGTIGKSCVNCGFVVELEPLTTVRDAEDAITIHVPTAVTVTIPMADGSYGDLVMVASSEGAPQKILETQPITDETGKVVAVTVTIESECDIVVVDNSLIFPDIADDFWAAKEIDYVSARDIIKGKLTGDFAATETITRKTVAMILWRIMGSPEVEADTKLSDVNLNDRYTMAICWAEDVGVITGYTDGTFRGDATLTRQHFAAMLYRFANYLDVKFAAASNKKLSEFTDFADIYGWAQEAVQWNVTCGFINGRANGTFDPQGNTTRAQLAVIMARFLQAYYAQ